MEIQLKNIKFSEALSEETNAFVADVYVNKVKVAYAKNDGQGGNTFYHAYEGQRVLLVQAEEFCKTLPPLKIGNSEYPFDLETKIDELLEEWLEAKNDAKFAKKLQKDILTGLCVKTANGYEQLVWTSYKRNNVSIADMVGSAFGREILKRAIAKLTAEGKEILNTNIPQHLF